MIKTSIIIAASLSAGMFASSFALPLAFRTDGQANTHVYGPVAGAHVQVNGSKVELSGDLPKQWTCEFSPEDPAYVSVERVRWGGRFTRQFYRADGSLAGTTMLAEAGDVVHLRGYFWREPPGRPEWSQFWIIVTCKLASGEIVRPRVGPFQNPERL